MDEEVEMVDFQLGNFIINIDSKTARMLCEDSKMAKNYHDEIRRQYPEAEASTSKSKSSVSTSRTTLVPVVEAANPPAESKIWTTSKNQTPLDLEATAFFLLLRKELDCKFRDKKTTNAALWKEIAVRMNGNGYFVGNGLDGKERCRQKFANLQQTYLKYMDRRRQTGEGKIEKPPFFDEIDAILGKSDKTDPVMILDSIPLFDEGSNVGQSLPSANKNQDNNNETCSPQQKENTEHIMQKNKFINSNKTLKPKKNDFYDKFYNLSEKSEERKKNSLRI